VTLTKCAECGADIDPRGQPKKYCRRQCKEQAYKRRKRGGKKRSDVRLLGAWKWSWATNPRVDGPPKTPSYRVLGQCQGCGQWFVASRMDRAKLYCNAKCRRGPGWGMRQCLTYGCRGEVPPGRSRCRQHGPRNKGRIGPNPYGAQHQRDAATLLATARYCAICGLPPQPGNPLEADHIIPLSLGGTATADNLQAAHKLCNIKKGGRNRLRWAK